MFVLRNKAFSIALMCSCLLAVMSCKQENLSNNDDNSDIDYVPQLIFKFVFDENQERLNNFGLPESIPPGNAAQTPRFNSISAHYVEMIPNQNTWLGNGEILYQGPETETGGATAINFDEARIVEENEVFLAVPLSDVTPDTYEYIRISLSYQNYTIDLSAYGFTVAGTLASFIGYNNYISSYTVNNESINVNGNRLQGYWAFETDYGILEGQVPAGAITVPNPLAASSPIPSGSCLVTGVFDNPISITGNEQENVVINISVSINNSFEWTDSDGNGLYNPLDSDVVVDMGIRGIIAKVQ